MLLYYAVVFVTSLFLVDLAVIQVTSVGPWGIYVMDIVNLGAVTLTVMALVGGGVRRLSRAGVWYVIFLGWLIVALAIGFWRYGFRSLGEFRYVLPFFWFFVPIAMDGFRPTRIRTEAATVTVQTIYVAAFAALLMLFLAMAHDGRIFISSVNRQNLGAFADFRGIKFLDSDQTFYIGLLGCLLFMSQPADGGRRGAQILSGILLCLLALVTRNRSAVIALAIGLALYAIAARRLRLLFAFTAGAAILVGLVALLSRSMADQVSLAFSSALSPTTDPTGHWRLAVQVAAVSQGLQKPWLGDGFGGYFAFELPGILTGTITAPPHNQFVLLFLKSGLVGVVLCLAALAAYARRLWSLRAAPLVHSRERLIARVLVVLLFSQLAYGLAYDFVPFYGLLLGFAEVMIQRQALRVAHYAPPTRDIIPAAVR